ncbi:MAG: RNA polymerase sigma factor [Chthoniobacterales bacterium]
MKPDESWVTRETLLNRVRRQHDEESWKEFVHYYRGYVYNIASRMGLKHHDAEEVVQDVMVKLWKKLPEFQYDSNKGRFRGWLCTVTANNVKLLWQKKSNDLDRLTPDEREDLTSYLHEIKTEPSHEMAEEEWASYVVKMAWDKVQREFGENEKAAFEMLSKGAGVDEISQSLGIASSSVYVYKKRVTDRLKQEVARLNRELD